MPDLRTQYGTGWLQPHPLKGYVWLEVSGRPRHVWAAHLKMRSEPLVEGEG
ncbi:MAG: hypothetical protein ACREOQ_17485 [Gemmatimonadales bacterium]